MLRYYNEIKKLAKTSKWQALFSLSKDRAAIGLFNNNTDFTAIQLDFLGWLSFYNNAQTEISMGDLPEWAYKKDIYIQAYNEYKSRERKSKNKEYRNLDTPKDPKQKIATGMKILFE